MPRPKTDRDRNLRVNMSTKELEMLHALADEAGLTVSDIVRLLTREGYARTFPDVKPSRTIPSAVITPRLKRLRGLQRAVMTTLKP
jgi:hypothetical protein